jgi:hypothetical protein
MGVQPSFATEVEFNLPKGYRDATGVLHRRGVMRLATAGDEIHAEGDPRVQRNPSYFGVIVLARVVTQLGDLPAVDTRTVESLLTTDFNFLQGLYQQVNGRPEPDDLAAPAEAEPFSAAVSPQKGFRTVGEA